MINKWSRLERKKQRQLRSNLQKIGKLDRYQDVLYARFSWNGRFRIAQFLRAGGEIHHHG